MKQSLSFKTIVAVLFWAQVMTQTAQSQTRVLAATEVHVYNSQQYADRDDPPCHDGSDHVVELAVGILEGKIPSVPQVTGTFFRLSTPQLAKWAAGKPGFVASLIAPDRYARCSSPVVTKLPTGATDVTVRVYSAEDDKQWKECTGKSGGSIHCPAPGNFSGWLYERKGDYIVATFKNWAHDRSRNGKIEIWGKAPQQHVVAQGENLSTIALKFYGVEAWQKIYEANKDKLNDANHLKPGLILEIPAK